MEDMLLASEPAAGQADLLDLVVELRDPADVLLLSVDSSITGSLANPAAEGANFTVTTSGTYYIKVRHFSATGTGTYHLMVSACSGASPVPTVSPETEPNDTSGTANVLDLSAPCGIVSGAINPGGDLDFYTFTGAPAGSRIWIETDTGGTQNAGATSRDTVIDLLAADGTTVIENDDDDGTGGTLDVAQVKTILDLIKKTRSGAKFLKYMKAQSIEEAGSLEAAVATIAARDYRKAISTLEEQIGKASASHANPS